MPRSFSSALRLPPNWRREPRIVARLALGILLLANVIAAWTVVSPVGGSSEELEAQIAGVRAQIEQRRLAVDRLRTISSRVEQGRSATDEFMLTHFMTRRTASSTIVSELIRIAKESGMRPKEHSFAFDPIEGTEDLTIMTVTGGYEGTYGDLLQFINRLDKSPRFLIMDTLTATPTQGTGNLTISIKMNTFVREEGPDLAPAGRELSSRALAATPASVEPLSGTPLAAAPDAKPEPESLRSTPPVAAPPVHGSPVRVGGPVQMPAPAGLTRGATTALRAPAATALEAPGTTGRSRQAVRQ